MEPAKDIHEIIAKAKEAETNDDYEQSAKLLEEAIKIDPLNEYAYERLMIIYRKKKLFKNELKTINSGIKSFENFYKKRIKYSRNKKIAEISNALMKSIGLSDKKGGHVYEPEPIA